MYEVGLLIISMTSLLNWKRLYLYYVKIRRNFSNCESRIRIVSK